jgi:cell division transport system permease protein
MLKYFMQALDNLKRYKTLAVDYIGIIVLALFLVSVYMLFVVNISNFFSSAKDKLDIIAFAQDPLSSKDLENIQKDIFNVKYVKKLSYVTKEESLEDFSKDPQVKREIEILGYNPLPAYFNIKIDKEHYYDIPNIALEITKIKGVTEVLYSKKNMQSFAVILKYFNFIGMIVGVFYSVIILLLLFYISKIALIYHREEIELMLMLGATRIFIRKLFISEGIIFGIISSIVSILLSFVFYLIVSTNIKHLIFLPILNIVIILILGFILGVISQLIVIKKCERYI